MPAQTDFITHLCKLLFETICSSPNGVKALETFMACMTGRISEWRYYKLRLRGRILSALMRMMDDNSPAIEICLWAFCVWAVWIPVSKLSAEFVPASGP